MKTNADYLAILKSLRTLIKSGKVAIAWHGMGAYASSEQDGDKPQVWLNESSCKIVLYIHKGDTLESLYEFLYANLEL